MLQPHRGYVSEWDLSTACIPGYDAVPQPRRCDPSGPMPVWWDLDMSSIWSAGTAGVKRAADDAPPAADDGGKVTPGESSQAAKSSGPAALAGDDPKPNALLILANGSWDVTKDQVPARIPVKARTPAERETKRARTE
jgi:hypothetical protein